MSDTSNSAPGFAKHPEHRVDLVREGRALRVMLGGVAVAESDDVVTVHESGYPPVHYFPRADVRTALLEATEHRTRCPFKGRASYWTLRVDGRVEENAAWSYETPYDEVAELRGRVAFYADRVDAIESLR